MILKLFLALKIVGLALLMVSGALALLFLASITPVAMTPSGAPATMDVNHDGKVDEQDAVQHTVEQSSKWYTSVNGQVDRTASSISAWLTGGTSFDDWLAVTASIAVAQETNNPYLPALTYVAVSADTINPLQRIQLEGMVKTCVAVESLRQMGFNDTTALIVGTGIANTLNYPSITQGNSIAQLACIAGIMENNADLAVIGGLLASTGGIDGNPYTPW